MYTIILILLGAYIGNNARRAYNKDNITGLLFHGAALLILAMIANA